MPVEKPHHNEPTVRVSFKSFCFFQYSAASVLIILGTSFYLYAENHGDGALHAILELFDPGLETSMTTTFSVLNLLISSVLLYVIYLHTRTQGGPMAFYWLVLSIMFLGLSIDEGAEIHERAGARFYEFTQIALPVIQNHRWLLAGALFTVIVAVCFIPFFVKLDARTRFLFLLSGGVFLSGALMFEFAGALMLYEGGYTRGDLLYRLRRILEEGCELFGIAIFNCTLLGLIRRKGATLRLGSQG